jgi:hypothetical protein
MYALLLITAGCGGAGSSSTPSPDGSVAQADLGSPEDFGSSVDLGGLACTGNETFQEARTAMLNNCSGFGPFTCHMTSPFSGGLDLKPAHAYQDLVNVPAMIAPTKLRVKPGDPANSFVVQKLTDTQGPTEGNPMPDPVEGLMWMPPNPTQLNILRCWVANGALNN